MRVLEHDRLFESFFDPVDAVICVPADMTGQDVMARAAAAGLRFPLLHDHTAPLIENFASGSFASASSRFGAICDNITGMNWDLPDGTRVRVGERVVKSTTGYDLQRFLLGSHSGLGTARDYVLRLRPLCDADVTFVMRGDRHDLTAFVGRVLNSCWIHWFDSMNWIEKSGGATVEIGVHCPAAETGIFEHAIVAFAREQNLRVDSKTTEPAGLLPDYEIKTTADRVPEWCEKAVQLAGGRTVGICAHGVVHGFTETFQSLPQVFASASAEWESEGGGWSSRHHLHPHRSPSESAWIEALKMGWA